MKTAHLASLGAHEIPRPEFSERVQRLVDQPGFAWPSGLWNFVW
jgi:Leu/Phe-tRNA-protein transferase